MNREDFSFVIHLDRQPRTSRRREAQTGSRARSGSRSERTLDAVEHSRTLMEWWPFLIFHRGGLRIKVINNTATVHRLLCRHDLMGKKAYEPTSKDRRRFAFDKANELWMSDVMHGPSVFADGKRKRKTYLIATLDDATRVLADESQPY